MNLRGYTEKIWNNYYYIVCAFYIISIGVNSFRVGVMLSLIMFVQIVLNIKKIRYLEAESLIVFLYIVFCVISFAWSAAQNTVNNYLTAITYTILPSAFYFRAQKIDENEKNNFWNSTFNALFVSMIVGFILYLWAPEFYGRFLVNKGYSSNYLKGWIRDSFQGIFGVTCTGSFCAMLCVYELGRVISGEKKRILRLFISIILLILTARKSAIIGFLLVMLLELCYLLKKKKINGMLLGCIVALGIIVFIVFKVKFPLLYESIIMRFSNIVGDFQGRRSIADKTIGGTGTILGNGFGSSGHIAGAMGATKVINDNSYLLIIAETGIIGLCIFLIMVLASLIKGMINYKECYFEVVILGLLLLQAIGSNIFEFQQLMPIFWFCLGWCSKTQKKLILK